MTTINLSESIIEYYQYSNSPAFQYDGKTGAITIFANESIWILKEKSIQMNSAIFYDYDTYVLLFLPYMKKKNINPVRLVIPSGETNMTLCNIGLLPRFIKKGELLGKAILIPRIESHIVDLNYRKEGL